MSFDLSSWLWWRLVSLAVVVVMWLLLAFGVSATPPRANHMPGGHTELEAAEWSFASEPCEGRLDWTARRFDSQDAEAQRRP